MYSVEEQTCAEYQFQCRNKICIDSHRKCDLRYDCRDGSDEDDCGMFCREQKTRIENAILYYIFIVVVEKNILKFCKLFTITSVVCFLHANYEFI